MMTETFPNFHAPLRCQPNLDYTHATIASAYATPVVSFMRAVCNDSATAENSSWPAAQHWRAGCGTVGQPEFECLPHPGPHTHVISAHSTHSASGHWLASGQ
eukprot:6869998-Prymnesium_polylepis.1